jgi:hypothetical protein
MEGNCWCLHGVNCCLCSRRGERPGQQDRRRCRGTRDDGQQALTSPWARHARSWITWIWIPGTKARTGQRTGSLRVLELLNGAMRAIRSWHLVIRSKVVYPHHRTQDRKPGEANRSAVLQCRLLSHLVGRRGDFPCPEDTSVFPPGHFQLILRRTSLILCSTSLVLVRTSPSRPPQYEPHPDNDKLSYCKCVMGALRFLQDIPNLSSVGRALSSAVRTLSSAGQVALILCSTSLVLCRTSPLITGALSMPCGCFALSIEHFQLVLCSTSLILRRTRSLILRSTSLMRVRTSLPYLNKTRLGHPFRTRRT